MLFTWRKAMSLFSSGVQHDLLEPLKIFRESTFPELNLFGGGEVVCTVRIRRGYILSDALRAFSRNRLKGNAIIRVQFLGEEAVDGGGPRREFLHKLLSDLIFSSCSATTKMCAFHARIRRTSTKKFLFASIVLFLCILQEGPTPCLFPKYVHVFLKFIALFLSAVADR